MLVNTMFITSCSIHVRKLQIDDDSLDKWCRFGSGSEKSRSLRYIVAHVDMITRGRVCHAGCWDRMTDDDDNNVT